MKARPCIVKAHAFGNDFLLVDAHDVPCSADRAGASRAMCAIATAASAPTA